MNKEQFEKKLESIITVDNQLEWRTFGCHSLFVDSLLWFDELKELSKFISIDYLTTFLKDGKFWLDIHFWLREV